MTTCVTGLCQPLLEYPRAKNLSYCNLLTYLPPHIYPLHCYGYELILGTRARVIYILITKIILPIIMFGELTHEGEYIGKQVLYGTLEHFKKSL